MSTLDCMAASPQRVADPNAQQMADMIRAFWISQIVGTFAQLAIPDQLAGGALSSGELARLLACHAGATHRLMRAAVELGLVASTPDGRFSLKALGEKLQSHVPGSMRELGHRIHRSRALAPMGTVERSGAHGTTPDKGDARSRTFSVLLRLSLRRARVHWRNVCVVHAGGG